MFYFVCLYPQIIFKQLIVTINVENGKIQLKNNHPTDICKKSNSLFYIILTINPYENESKLPSS